MSVETYAYCVDSHGYKRLHAISPCRVCQWMEGGPTYYVLASDYNEIRQQLAAAEAQIQDAWREVACSDDISAPLLTQAINQIQRARDRAEAERDRAVEALQFLMQTQWRSADKDNMEFDGRVTCYQLDKARAAIDAAIATAAEGK